MASLNERYGNVHIKEKTLSIDNSSINELDDILEELEKKKFELIEQQNKLLSNIIE